MLLKNHLIEVFKQASLENNFLLKENVVLKWVHRFGIDSLNDLLIHSSLQKENQREEENQEHKSLIDEVHKENQKQISLIDEVHEDLLTKLKVELAFSKFEIFSLTQSQPSLDLSLIHI